MRTRRIVAAAAAAAVKEGRGGGELVWWFLSRENKCTWEGGYLWSFRHFLQII
jgi:hypothetical protein